MAHHKRKRPRTSTSGGYSGKAFGRRLDGKWGGAPIREHNRHRWCRNYPRWHDKLFHTRPRRRNAHRLEFAVIKGADSEDLAWPHDHKPHVYYW